MKSLCTTAVFFLLGVPAFAGSITSLPALGANDLVDWSVKGANETNGFIVSSDGGLGVAVSEGNSAFVTLIQNGPGGWFGNFPIGTTVIYNQGSIGPVAVAFDSPIRGFGVTIDDVYSGNFSGTIQAYDGANFLESYTIGPSPYGLMFLGLLDATADITSVYITTTNVTGNNHFAFGNLYLVDGASSSIPEPASITTALLGLGVVATARHLRSPKCFQPANTDINGK